MLSYICCCAREDDTQQPTPNLEYKRNNETIIKYEDDNTNSLKLEVAEFKPETPRIHKYPYYCPICFRYFNKMLKTNCCNNFICELCSNDLEEKNKNMDLKCLYCTAEHIVLKNVQPTDIIKKYTDSPYIEKVVKHQNETKKSKFSKDLSEKFTLNDVLQGQKQSNIAQILENALNKHNSDSFVKIYPSHSSKRKVIALRNIENEQLVQELTDFKHKLDNMIRRQKINERQQIKVPEPSKQIKTYRFLSLT